jgi:hypothetical protein
MPHAIVALFAFIGIGISVGTATTILVSTIMTAATFLINKLIPKPKFDLGMGNDQRFAQISFPSTDATRVVVYGNTRIGATVTGRWFSGTNNEKVWVLYTLTGCELTSIDQVYFDDELIEIDGSGDATGRLVGLINIQTRLGAAGETAFAELVSLGYMTTDDRQDGCAKVLIRAKWNADQFPNGYPQKVSFQVKGRPIYDPRTDDTASADELSNPALIYRDFMCDPIFGFGADAATEIDDASITTAANICSELVDRSTAAGGGTRYRFRAHGGFSTDADLFEITKGIMSAFAARPTMIGGKIGVVAGAWIEPEITLTDDDFSGGLQVPARRSRRELFNGVRGRFRNPAISYSEDNYPSYQGADYVTEDGQEFWTELDLPFTSDPEEATSLAKIHLERHRRMLTPLGHYKLGGYQVQPPNTVYINHPRFGWTNKTFEVVESTLLIDGGDSNKQAGDDDPTPVMSVDLALAETDADVYAWDADTDAGTATDHTANGGGTNLVVQAVTGLTLTSNDTTATTGADGIKIPRIKVAWTAPDDAFVLSGGQIIIGVKLHADSAYTWLAPIPGYSTELYIGGVTVGSAYDVRVIAESNAGVRSAATDSNNHTVAGPMSDIVSSTPLNGQGSIPPAGISATATITGAGSTTPVARVQVIGGTIYRSDGSTITVPSSGPTDYTSWAGSTVLNSTNYNGNIVWDLVGAAVARQEFNGNATIQTKAAAFVDKKVPIAYGINFTTPSSGGSGGGGGGRIGVFHRSGGSIARGRQGLDGRTEA